MLDEELAEALMLPLALPCERAASGRPAPQHTASPASLSGDRILVQPCSTNSDYVVECPADASSEVPQRAAPDEVSSGGQRVFRINRASMHLEYAGDLLAGQLHKRAPPRELFVELAGLLQQQQVSFKSRLASVIGVQAVITRWGSRPDEVFCAGCIRWHAPAAWLCAALCNLLVIWW